MDNHQPINPILLQWKNLRYELTEWSWPWSGSGCWLPKRQTKVILRRLNGSVRQNSLNALLGPSGAGKTSLIKCLTGNISSLSHDSEIHLNRSLVFRDNKCDSGTLKNNLVGLVPQFVHEIMFGRFSVEEILYYAFCFKNSSYDKQTVKQHILYVIEELMLDPKVLKTPFEKCSGGEQRRIAIAQELMTLNGKPPFLFVDEPTTGLDSESALVVMQCLRRLTNRNPITIIVSIHAPSSDILNLFDQLIVLARGGVCIYSDSPGNMQPFLRSVLDVKLEDDRPAIEEFLRIASNGVQDEQVQKLANDTLDRQQTRMINEQNHLVNMPNGMPSFSKTFSFKDLRIQITRLLRWIFVVDIRTFLGILFLNGLLIFLIVVVCHPEMLKPDGCYPLDMSQYNRTCQQDLDDIILKENYKIFQLILLILLTIHSMGFSAILLSFMMKVIRNEHQNAWYSLGTFFWSLQFVHILEFTIFIIIDLVICYISIGYHGLDNNSLNWNRFGLLMLYYWLWTMYLQSHGHIWGTVFGHNLQLLIIFLQLVFAQINLVNGIMVTLEIMNKPFLLNISYLIGVRHLAEGLLYAIYGVDRCDQDTEYSAIIQEFYIDEKRIFSNILPTIVNSVLLRLAAFIVLYWLFGSFRKLSLKIKKFAKKLTNKNHKPTIQKKLMAIDFYDNIPTTDVATVHDNNETVINVSSSPNEQSELNFFKDRFMVGWRCLNLYANGSIYETRPPPKSFDSTKKVERLILRNLNGQIRFGTITALMGTSGSGKTTLLKVLNGRMKTRLANSTQFYLSKFASIRTCFIAQEISGHLLPGLTAIQSLIYASRLKNSLEENVDHEQIAWKILEELDITDTANTKVQKCSGGQRKRLALALELTSVRMPNLICIDEPTSGLDSNSARLVIDCLKRLVGRHPDISIVVSIHQPNTELLLMFDQCYVLARDGVNIYSGHPSHIKHHLNKVPESLISTSFPIETLIKYSCSGYNNPVVKKLTQLTEQQIKQEVDQTELLKDMVAISDGVSCNRIRFSLKSIWILSQRYMLYLLRHQWKEWLIYVAIYLTIGATMANFYDKTIAKPSGCVNIEADFNAFCTNRSESMVLERVQQTNNLYYIFFCALFFLIALSMQTMFTFNSNLKFFYNEHRNGWYSSGSFYGKELLFETITMVPIVIAYVWVTDIFTEVTPNDYYPWQVLILTMASTSYQAISHFIVLVTNGHEIFMIILLTLFIAPFVMLSNLFNPITSMPSICQLVSNFSILRFINQATFWLVYGGDRCQLDNEIQTTLYMLNLPNTREAFNGSVLQLGGLVIFYHVVAILILMFKSNPLTNRQERVERIEKYRLEKLLKFKNPIPTEKNPTETTLS